MYIHVVYGINIHIEREIYMCIYTHTHKYIYTYIYIHTCIDTHTHPHSTPPTHTHKHIPFNPSHLSSLILSVFLSLVCVLPLSLSLLLSRAFSLSISRVPKKRFPACVIHFYEWLIRDSFYSVLWITHSDTTRVISFSMNDSFVTPYIFFYEPLIGDLFPMSGSCGNHTRDILLFFPMNDSFVTPFLLESLIRILHAWYPLLWMIHSWHHISFVYAWLIRGLFSMHDSSGYHTRDVLLFFSINNSFTTHFILFYEWLIRIQHAWYPFPWMTRSWHFSSLLWTTHSWLLFYKWLIRI